MTRLGLSHTDWAMILDASQENSTRADQALDVLVRRYWPAVYAFIRASGHDVHESSDLTQSFVCDIVLSRKLIRNADPQRGRFRALLVAALKNYLRQVTRSATRQKRAPRRPFRIEPAMTETLADDSTSQSPDAAFATQWSATLIHHVLEEVRRECLAAGLEAHWTIFEARVVRPMLFGEPRTPYAMLAERLDLKHASQAANMLVTAKRRFAQGLLTEVGRTISDPSQVEDEVRQLLRDLERST